MYSDDWYERQKRKDRIVAWLTFIVIVTPPLVVGAALGYIAAVMFA